MAPLQVLRIAVNILRMETLQGIQIGQRNMKYILR